MPPRPALSLPSAAPRRGITLIELAIGLVIAAILASAALPNYLASVRKGKRQDAADALNEVLQAQERWRGDHTSYADSMSALSLAATSRRALYTLAIADATASGYTVSASAVASGSQAGDTGCTTLTVTVAAGNPTYAPSGCWLR